MSEKKSCTGCEHFTRTVGTIGACRRYPPTVIVILSAHPMTGNPISEGRSEFPIVADRWVCGERKQGGPQLAVVA